MLSSTHLQVVEACVQSEAPPSATSTALQLVVDVLSVLCDAQHLGVYDVTQDTNLHKVGKDSMLASPCFALPLPPHTHMHAAQCEWVGAVLQPQAACPHA